MAKRGRRLTDPHHARDVLRVGDHLRPAVQARHLVMDDGNADGVIAARYVTVMHGVSWVRESSQHLPAFNGSGEPE